MTVGETGAERLGHECATYHEDQIVYLPVELLVTAGSPRLAGEDLAHARVLAETPSTLPPIIVHRATMRVIDGMHRLRAARINGARKIAAQFFDGDDDAAFVLSVKVNTAHGLPLTLADRKAAAERVVAAYPEWSDRSIADVTGLSHKTVGALRRLSTGENTQLPYRIGRDGRIRPLDGPHSRRRATDLLRQNPEASPEDISRASGVSQTAVRDLRSRLLDGDQLVPPPRRAPPSGASQRIPVTDLRAIVRQLSTDPSLRFSEAGRTLLRWLDASPRTVTECDELADNVPSHCRDLISQLALRCADSWQRFAARLEQDSRD